MIEATETIRCKTTPEEKDCVMIYAFKHNLSISEMIRTALNSKYGFNLQEYKRNNAKTRDKL